MSFLFNCCREDPSKKAQYQVQRREGNKIITEYVTPDQLKNKTGQILRVNRSQYDDLVKNYNEQKKWTDPTFPPGPASLGNINNVPPNCEWKRIPEIVQNPQLFVDKIQPKDVIQGSLGDCYFLSALSALAENEGGIRQVFGNQTYNPAGIYKVLLRIDGHIQQILVDDFVPVNKSNRPLFCQPNKNQIWVLLLEKAWAKAHGSYANINSGTPSEVFKAVTYAPSELRPIKRDPQSMEKLWRDIVQNNKTNKPACFGTLNDPSIDWKSIGLTPGHAYTLIDTLQAQGEGNNNIYRVIQLRNPWGFNQWKGVANENDHAFWSNIHNTPEKQKFLSATPFGNDGVFNMLYEDFCRYFNEAHFCYVIHDAVYQVQPLIGQNGGIYHFNIAKPGEYIIQLHQKGLRGDKDPRIEEGLNRSTLLLAKGNNFEFLDGSLKYHEQDNSLRANLTPGQYYLYAQIDKTLQKNLIPQTMSVSMYSNNFVDLKPIDAKAHPDFFRKVFLSFARNNRRKQFENGLMWISWKLLFEKGGFAYLAFGVDPKCDKKFHVSIKQSDFNGMGYDLEPPHLKRGNQVLEIRPGQEQVIVARVRNAPLQPMKFPPPMEIQIEKA